MSVRWVWSGAVTDDGFTVSAGLDSGDTTCRLAVSTSADMSSPSYGSVAVPDDDHYVKASIDGLSPATQYWYQIEVNGSLDTGRTGKCKTFPTANQPASFSFAFGSCSDTGSNTRSYEGIAASGVDFFVHLGDKHYEDIGVNDESLFVAAHEQNFTAANQRAFHESCAVAYTWSDHDYGPNNSDRTATGRAASCAVYRKIVPHWPLSDPDGIWQSFKVGRTLFIVTDERSYRDPNNTEPQGKTMLGAAQIEWMMELCKQAAADDTALIVWASDQQINMPLSVLDEHWGRYEKERDRVGSILASAGVPVVAITGDEHRSGFVRSYVMGNGQIMICHHGAIASADPVAVFGVTSHRGRHGWDWGTEHHKGFGRIDITDDGGHPKIRFRVNAVNQTTGVVTVPFDSGDIELDRPALRIKQIQVNSHARRHIVTPAETPEPEPFNILTSVGWYASYWAENPAWTAPANGATAAQWDDASGNARHVSQATAGNRPIFRSSVAALNNKPALEFTTDCLTSPAASWGTLTQPVSIVTIMQWVSPDASTDTIIGAGSGGGNFLLRKTSSSVIGMFVAAGLSGAAPNSNAHLFGGVYNGASSSLIYDGTLTSGNVGAGSMAGITIGGAAATASTQTVNIAFVGVYEGIITGHAKWAELKSWVTSTYAITM